MPNKISKGKRRYLLSLVAHAAEVQRVDESVARYIVAVTHGKVPLWEARKRVADQKQGRRVVREMSTGNPGLNRLLDGGLRRGVFHVMSGR
jgi:hypothetical protein